IDLAVHSLKDLPADSPPDLRLAAVTARVDPADVLISKGGLTLEQLPKNATILTGAPRRRAQLLHYRPDLRIADVRGNVPTRLRKLDESNAHALIIAAAGLIRLDLQSRITQRLDPADFLPAPGQGALALEIRSDNTAAAELLASLDDPDSRCATTAERTVLSHLRAGCQVPIGAYARIENRELSLHALLSDPDGRNLLTAYAAGSTESPEQLGRRVAQQLLDQGGQKILDK
ncbi:MAG: hydroxymethylbilane synthase, partial [Sedimentisphaerales bacterium]|nr:hydroxymethylbilane synthase [Sedimentisphaerales bacterium]